MRRKGAQGARYYFPALPTAYNLLKLQRAIQSTVIKAKWWMPVRADQRGTSMSN